MTDKKRKLPPSIRGIVVSDKMDKTVVVLIEKRFRHPRTKKTVLRTKRIKVHDPHNRAKVGDYVLAYQTRHYSKEKFHRLIRILEKKK